MRSPKQKISHRLYMRQYRKTKKNREYVSNYTKDYYKRPYARIAKNLRQQNYRKKHGYPPFNRLTYFNSYLKHKYNISLEQYDKLLKSQDFRCSICRTSVTKLTRRLAVDHNHKTNAIRGLLCNKCNSALGNLQDSIKLLQSAIKYLKKFK